MSSIRGYSGYYNNNYLRSSYEYVYCKILEKQNLNYTIEEIVYDLEKCKYIPDFHVYDNNNKLLKIVEIKSNNNDEIIKANNKINLLKLQIDVPIVLYKLKDLKRICSDINLDINNLIKFWITNSNGNDMSNNKNPMYGNTHKDSSKKLISEKSLARWQNDFYKDRIIKGMQNYYSNNSHHLLGKEKTDRIHLKCKECDRLFKKKITSSKIYCSKQCGLVSSTKIANISVRNKNRILHQKIKNDILNYIHINYSSFILKKRNKLYEEFKKILNNYKLKDVRNIKFIFTGYYCCSFDDLYFRIEQDYKNYLKCMPNLHDDKV